MSLLTDLFRGEYRGGLVDDYRIAANQRATPRGDRVPGRQVVLLVVGVVILGLLFAVTAVQTRRSAPAAAAERQSLIERVRAATERTDGLKLQLADVQKELSDAQEAALTTTGEGAAVQQQLDRLSVQSGAAEVTGPGIRVTVDDAAEDDTSGDDDPTQEGRILDIDLQELVNGLWAAGAEAVSIDGQRVTSRASIRMAGDAIFMDLQPLTRPYEILAIGDPSNLGARFADSYGGAWMQTLAATYGVRFDVGSDDQLTIPAASSLGLEVAQPPATVDPEGASGP
jgi:uncharacterized protein YlxW (UPF0749 family)